MRTMVNTMVSLTFICGLFPGSVNAAPLKIEAVMAPKEQIQLDFADRSRRFVLMVKCEGKATGTGSLAGRGVLRANSLRIETKTEKAPINCFRNSTTIRKEIIGNLELSFDPDHP